MDEGRAGMTVTVIVENNGTEEIPSATASIY